MTAAEVSLPGSISSPRRRDNPPAPAGKQDDWRVSSADTAGAKAPSALARARLEANAAAIHLVAVFRLSASFDDRTWTLVEAVIAELIYKCQIFVTPQPGRSS